jgi:hypothetical protein
MWLNVDWRLQAFGAAAVPGAIAGDLGTCRLEALAQASLVLGVGGAEHLPASRQDLELVGRCLPIS